MSVREIAGHPAEHSAHLVDPELIPLLREIAPFQLTAGTLAEARRNSEERRRTAPDAALVFPGTTAVEHLIPGLGDDPKVRIVHIARVDDPPRCDAALIWAHGGGYVVGAADANEDIARRIVAETGVQVFSVDYRLAPETPAPGAVRDCYAALGWLHAHAGDFGIDPRRVGIAGESAGGGLAAATTILARHRGETPLAVEFLIYPMLDDRTGSTVDPAPPLGELLWTVADNRFAWSAQLGRAPGHPAGPGGPDVSPYAAPSRVASAEGLPPAFVSVGALDLFLAEDVAYAARLASAGVPVELHVYPRAFHAFDHDPTAAVSRAARRDLFDAIARWAARGATEG